MNRHIDPVVVLRQRVKRVHNSNMSAFARTAGVSAPFVSAVMKRSKRPSPKLLRALGLERVIRVEYRQLPRRAA